MKPLRCAPRQIHDERVKEEEQRQAQAYYNQQRAANDGRE